MASYGPNKLDATGQPEQKPSGEGESGWAPGTAPASATQTNTSTTRTPAGSTRSTRQTCSVEDVWGDGWDDVTPRHTLKGPASPAKVAPSLDLGALRGPPPGLSLQGYELLEVLGEGGVGVVYQAIQKSIDRMIAVKMIRPRAGQDAEEKQKFVSEALVTGKLDHPNIVPIHDVSTTPDGQPFYTMKMVRGTSWSDVVMEKSLAENVRILVAVCDAVSFAHSRGVIHRDLKPANVMLGEFGEVQLMDWGLGAPVSSEGDLVDPYRTHSAGGTPAYMAPEMVTGADGVVGTHSDVYLLGAVLYELVTGHPPHAGKRVLDCLRNAQDNVIQPTEHTGALVDIARIAMHTEPKERYGSVKEFKEALLDYQAHAESISLCERSYDKLQRAQQERNYEKFAEALFGLKEALVLWADNGEARAGVDRTKLSYARCAFDKGDLDLAGSTLDPDCPDHRDLAAQIRAAQTRRETARRRLRLFRTTALSLTVAVVLILTVASIWIYRAKRQAETAREDALAAQRAEAAQRSVAEAAMHKAQTEEARAVKALADLKQAYTDLVEAQEQERRARAEAAESERVATKTRDELAKTGMLLDNSWWASDATAIREAQEKAAAAIGMPSRLTISLADQVDLHFILIPPGEFVMGSPPKEENRTADEHLHRVHHRRAFYMSEFELTEAQWEAVTGKSPRNADDRRADPTLPVSQISYDRIIRDLLPALRKYSPEGYELRLPTEAEWEYACRAGTATAYYGGDGEDALQAVAWYATNSDRTAKPVGGKPPNALGAYDMHGNVNEICADRFDVDFYLESPVEDPLSTGVLDNLVVRGGSVMNTPEHCRSAYRSYVYYMNEYPFVGLRLALAPIQPDRPVMSSRPTAASQPVDGNQSTAPEPPSGG